MKKIGVNVYSVDELDKDVKARVLDMFRDDLNDVVISEIEHKFEKLLEEYGYPTDDIRYRLTYCQGDGVAFYGTINLENFIFNRFLDLSEDLTKDDLRRINYIVKEGLCIHIEKSQSFHLYDHYNTMIVWEEDADAYMHEDSSKKDIDNMIISVKKLREFIEDDIVNLSIKMESIGYDIIEEYKSDKSVEDYLNWCDLYFTEDGTMIDIHNCEII